MTRISQRELRNHMAKVLDELEATGEAEVTTNNEPVAILSPLSTSPLDRMFRSGQATQPKVSRLPVVERVHMDRSSTDVLIELKGDG